MSMHQLDSTATALGLRTRPVLLWVALAVAALGLLLPISTIWSVHYPAMIDAYNHLARHYLELQYFRGEPLPAGIVVHYKLLPNLGGDLVIPFLILLFGPLAGLKAFLTLSVLLYWLGPSWFVLALGRGRDGAAIACLFLLPFLEGGAFYWGFLNFYSGLGLAFLVGVHLLFLTRALRLPWWQWILHAALIALLFVWHLAAFVIYGMILAAVMLDRSIGLRRGGRTWWQAVHPSLLLAIPAVPSVGLYAIYAAGPHPGGVLEWEKPLRKMIMPMMVVHGYSLVADVATIVLTAAALVLCYGPPRRVADERLAVLLVAVLGVVYWVLPLRLGTTYGADARILPALLICAVACLGVLRVRWSWAAAACLTGVLLVRNLDTYLAWRQIDQRLAQEAQSIDYIAPGARVLPLIFGDESSKTAPERFLATLAVIEKHAYVPNLFAVEDQQPLRLPDVDYANERAAALAGDPAVFARYDYLWISNPDNELLDVPAGWSTMFTSHGVKLMRRDATVAPQLSNRTQ